MATVFGLLGGLALFIFGMNMMSESLQKVAGDKMKKVLGVLTRNAVCGMLAGALVTAVLQSSSATTVLVIGFVSAGLMSFRKQAFSATYIFDDTGFTIEHKYGTTHYDFDQIKHVTMVIPDENMIFYILNVFTEKERYTISFMMQKELCENIYEFMHARLPKKDTED